MLEIPYYRVHTFTQTVDGGNPAGVCPLTHWLPDKSLQLIAHENRLSETAFFVPSEGHMRLRWFTPGCEVDLCGHATLATAFVLSQELGLRRNRYSFETRSGEIEVRPEGNSYILDMPAQDIAKEVPPSFLSEALGGVNFAEVFAADDLLVVLEQAQTVASLTPEFSLLKKIPYRGTIVTAACDDGRYDFVSRWFGSERIAVDEDPVTGSAHRTLAPFWSKRLQKGTLRAQQVSPRGGELICSLKEDRVEVAGTALLYSSGKIFLPDDLA